VNGAGMNGCHGIKKKSHLCALSARIRIGIDQRRIAVKA
jgi:hypothetical protein